MAGVRASGERQRMVLGFFGAQLTRTTETAETIGERRRRRTHNRIQPARLCTQSKKHRRGLAGSGLLPANLARATRYYMHFEHVPSTYSRICPVVIRDWDPPPTVCLAMDGPKLISLIKGLPRVELNKTEHCVMT